MIHNIELIFWALGASLFGLGGMLLTFKNKEIGRVGREAAILNMFFSFGVLLLASILGNSLIYLSSIILTLYMLYRTTKIYFQFDPNYQNRYVRIFHILVASFFWMIANIVALNSFGKLFH